MRPVTSHTSLLTIVAVFGLMALAGCSENSQQSKPEPIVPRPLPSTSGEVSMPPGDVYSPESYDLRFPVDEYHFIFNNAADLERLSTDIEIQAYEPVTPPVPSFYVLRDINQGLISTRPDDFSPSGATDFVGALPTPTASIEFKVDFPGIYHSELTLLTCAEEDGGCDEPYAEARTNVIVSYLPDHAAIQPSAGGFYGAPNDANEFIVNRGAFESEALNFTIPLEIYIPNDGTYTITEPLDERLSVNQPSEDQLEVVIHNSEVGPNSYSIGFTTSNEKTYSLLINFEVEPIYLIGGELETTAPVSTMTTKRLVIGKPENPDNALITLRAQPECAPWLSLTTIDNGETFEATITLNTYNQTAATLVCDLDLLVGETTVISYLYALTVTAN